MRGSAVSHAWSWSRRTRYSSSIAVTVSAGPLSAATVAFCEIEQTLDVEWLCRALLAAITSAGPSAHPQRQPVIAYDLLAEPHRMVLSRQPRRQHLRQVVRNRLVDQLLVAQVENEIDLAARQAVHEPLHLSLGHQGAGGIARRVDR